LIFIYFYVIIKQKYFLIYLFSGGYKIMAYVITDECIACGACESECPVSCIKQEGDKYVINKEECTECGSCEGVCPVDAPKPEEK
jgi:ferredoxin